MGVYAAGNKVRLSVAFTDNAGAAIDPTSLSLKYGFSVQAITTQLYNPGNVVRDSTGNYHYDFDTTGTIGKLSYEWIATGTGQASVPGSIIINSLPL